MSGPGKVTVRIDRLNWPGAGPGEAEALAETLKTELGARLAADPGGLPQAAERLRLNLPHGQRAAIGAGIASALSPGGGPTRGRG